MSVAMTPRERTMAAIDHRPVDRIPTDYWGTPEITQKLIKGLGAKDAYQMLDMLGVDGLRGVGPKYIGPQLLRDGEISADYWGVQHKTISYANSEGSYGEIYKSPLADFTTIDEIEANYTWPSADWFDFSSVKEQCSQLTSHAIQGGYMAPFYMYTNIRGLEQTLIDLAADEEVANYIIGRISDFYYDYHQRFFDAAEGKIDVAQVTDDFGTQTGLMISLNMFDKYFKKQYQRFIKLVKDHGIRVFHHDDGAIMPLLPRLVELGIDILNPIQWHLPGMDLQELKNRFGKDLCFHGGIDNQHVLPFGTVDEVVKEVRTCLEILGGDGTGYILAPCHNIQVISPIENVVAMYKTAAEFGVN